MTSAALLLLTLAGVPAESQQRAANEIKATSSRYFSSAIGPITVSAAHFLAAMVFLHGLPRATFGLFSFLLVISPFCLSLCGAVFSPPLARQIAHPAGMQKHEQMTLLKANIVFSLLASLAIAGAMLISGAVTLLAMLLGLYGGLMCLRWFERCRKYAEQRIARVLASDLVYSGVLCSLLLMLAAARRVDIWNGAAALLFSALAGTMVLIFSDLGDYVEALPRGRLAPFLEIWRQMSGWAVVGVALSELAVNAHAYLVTFISGPRAFALLALGSLLMRPVSLVLAALPDMERPLMSRALNAGKKCRAFQIVKEFRTAAGAIWLVTALSAAALLTWFPFLILKKDYALRDVAAVVAISAAIAALRAFRTPQSVLLQAAGEFRRLAAAGALASVVSMISAFILLLLAGPIAALLGILIGELVANQRTFTLFRAWKAAHG